MNSQEIAQLPDLFSTPIRAKRVRAGIIAHQYANGTINISGQKFVGYSMSEAIKLFRHKFPANPTRKKGGLK